MALFLKRKFAPYIRRKFPQHYLVQPIPYKNLEYIHAYSQRHPYFLSFDIKLYYPSIDHSILLQKLPYVYNKISQRRLSRRFKKYLKAELPLFLSQSPYQKGLSIGSFLSYILTGIFLLGLDLEIKNPFLRYVDDYLVFCKNKDEPYIILQNIIQPKLKELGLEINLKKLSCGRFHRDRVGLIGFDFYAGYFQIAEAKLEEFKKRITNITHLTHILAKYGAKKRVIWLKSRKKKSKTVNSSIAARLPNISESIDGIRYCSILKELKQITKRLTGVEGKIAKIERKLNKA